MFNFCTPIFDMRLDCKSKILRSLHQFCRCSIFSMSSWCKESSSRVDMTHSLCSLLLRTNSSVTETQLNGYNLLPNWCLTYVYSFFYTLPKLIIATIHGMPYFSNSGTKNMAGRWRKYSLSVKVGRRVLAEKLFYRT